MSYFLLKIPGQFLVTFNKHNSRRISRIRFERPELGNESGIDMIRFVRTLFKIENFSLWLIN